MSGASYTKGWKLKRPRGKKRIYKAYNPSGYHSRDVGKRTSREGSWHKHSVTGQRIWVPKGGDLVRYLD